MMEWTEHAGIATAKALIAQYPTPRDLRQAIAKQGWNLLSANLRTLPWSADGAQTIGDVITYWQQHPEERPDIAHVHGVIAFYARDYHRWIAPDGTVTIS